MWPLELQMWMIRPRCADGRTITGPAGEQRARVFYRCCARDAAEPPLNLSPPPPQVVHVSGAAVLQAALPGCQVDLLDDCGHTVTLERPRKAAKLILNFLSAQSVNGESMKKLS